MQLKQLAIFAPLLALAAAVPVAEPSESEEYAVKEAR